MRMSEGGDGRLATGAYFFVGFAAEAGLAAGFAAEAGLGGAAGAFAAGFTAADIAFTCPGSCWAVFKRFCMLAEGPEARGAAGGWGTCRRDFGDPG